MSLGIAACATPRSFVPAERATAITAHGYPAAEYEVKDAKGQLGDVKLWSRGARRENRRGEKETFAHVGIDIDNQTGAPMLLRSQELFLEGATLDDGALGPLRPTFLQGDTTIPAGKDRTVELWFAFPVRIAPSDVRAFRLAWTVTGEQFSYSQRTPFLQAQSRYYYSPYHDPFLHDPFVFHGGVGIHPHPYYHLHHPPYRRFTVPRHP